MTSTSVRRGEIWLVKLDPVVGSEQGKTRPCIVVQRDAANRRSPTTIVAPLTDSRDREETLLRIIILAGEGGLRKSSFVLCNQLRAVDLSRFVGVAWGAVTESTMRRVSRALCAIMDLAS